MEKIRQLLSDAGNAFSRLSPREQGLVSLAAVMALVFVIGITALTVSRSMTSSEGRIKTKMTQLEEVAKLASGYDDARREQAQLESRLRSSNVRLFSYLEDLARKQSIEIGGMNDKGAQNVGDSNISEQSVEVTFTRISIDKLVKFLQEVERGSGIVKVTRLQLRPRRDEPVIDAWLTVSTYQLAG